MKTKIIVCIFLLMGILASCSESIGTNSDLSDNDVSSEMSLEEDISLPEYTDNFNILFIGNSLTFTGGIPEKFKALIEQEGKNVNIQKKVDSGYTLYQHYGELNQDDYDEIIEKADVVCIQEYGGYGLSTAKALKCIMMLFDLDTRFYFLLTEFDIPNRVGELKEVKNITYIPSGIAHNNLLDEGFNYDDLHIQNDYHPNSLYGYVAALTVYSTIFDIDCRGFSSDSIEKNTYYFLPGETDEEKEESVNVIQKCIMDALEFDLSVYKEQF